jgi:hypothetical protein
MSIVQYANKSYSVIQDFKDDDSYFNYSHCQNNKTKEYVVVEKINKEKLKKELIKLPILDLNKTYEDYLYAYKKDIQLLKGCDCKNLLKGIDFIDEVDQIIIVKEYADMNLKDYIKKQKGHGILPKEIRYIFNQLNNALEIFRNKKNVHTCLCNENIFLKFNDYGLVTDDYTVKMADFGTLSKYEVNSKFQLNIKRKIAFMAPELFTSNEKNILFSDKVDLWSLGVLLYFLRFNELPFESELYKTYKIFPDPQDPLLKDLINKLLVFDPNKRMTWKDYIHHKFFDVPKDEEKEIKIKRLMHRNKTIRKTIIGLRMQGKNGKMNITYDNGDKYDGEFVENVKEGKGIYYYNNGDVYKGEFFEDLKDGYGVYTYKNGDRYEGEFKEDKKDGHGKYYYNNGDRYEGEFKNGMANGRGAYIFSDGEKYVGDYKEDKRDGHGIYFYLNGNRYIGEFKNGKKDGKGVLYDSEGNKIKDLCFEDNVKIHSQKEEELPRFSQKEKNGTFTKIYEEGKYVGEFVNGLKQGKGTFFYDNGDKYVGDFYNDNKEGFGIYYFNNGDKYEGQYVNNQREGKGTYFYADGDKLVGTFKNNMAEGRGKFYYNDGDRYFGTYKADLKHGQGIYYYKDGSRYDGEFKKGKKMDME